MIRNTIRGERTKGKIACSSAKEVGLRSIKQQEFSSGGQIPGRKSAKNFIKVAFVYLAEGCGLAAKKGVIGRGLARADDKVFSHYGFPRERVLVARAVPRPFAGGR